MSKRINLRKLQFLLVGLIGGVIVIMMSPSGRMNSLALIWLLSFVGVATIHMLVASPQSIENSVRHWEDRSLVVASRWMYAWLIVSSLLLAVFMYSKVDFVTSVIIFLVVSMPILIRGMWLYLRFVTGNR